MTGATFTPAGKGRWALKGVLDFSSVADVWPELEKLLKTSTSMTVSLAGVRQSNSAGVVMLVEARDLARRSRCRLQLVDLPAGMVDLARMSRCDTLITQNAA